MSDYRPADLGTTEIDTGGGGYGLIALVLALAIAFVVWLATS